jgi:hypothetical protein
MITYPTDSDTPPRSAYQTEPWEDEATKTKWTSEQLGNGQWRWNPYVDPVVSWDSVTGKPASAFGTTAGTFAEGNDSRLSDSRTPTAHTHGSITNDGKIGSTADQVVTTTTDGAVTTASRSGIDSRSAFPPDMTGITPAAIGAATAAQGTLADTAVQPGAVVAFSNTTRPTSAGTGEPAATSLITRNDAQNNMPFFGPAAKYFAAGSTMQGSIGNVETAIGPLSGTRMDAAFLFSFGAVSGPAQAIMVPFFVPKTVQVSTAVINHTVNVHATAVLYGAIYAPDSAGHPGVRISDVFSWPLDVLGNKNAAFTPINVSGFFYVGILPSIGNFDYNAGSTGGLTIRGGQNPAGLWAAHMFGYNRTLPANAFGMAKTYSNAIAALPDDWTNLNVLRATDYGPVFMPGVLLF